MPISEIYSDVIYDVSDDEDGGPYGLKINLKKSQNREKVAQIVQGKDITYDSEELFERPEIEEDAEVSKSFRDRLVKLQRDDASRIDLLSDTAEFIAGTKFEEMRAEMTDMLGQGKIYKKVIKSGAGDCPPSRSLITFHYASFCVDDEVDSSEPFDSSYLRDRPDRKRIGVMSVIGGIEIALSSMRRGEESYFLIHPDLAYGKQGVPPRILPDCWILFSARLIRWNDCSGATEYERMTDEERREAPWPKLKAALLNLKECGIIAFRAGDLQTAERLLRKARSWLLNAVVKDEETEVDVHQLSSRLYRNLFIVLYKLGGEKNYKIALTCINDTLQLKNVPKEIQSQCFFYKGCIKRKFGEYDGARDYLKRALRASPNDQCIVHELNLLESDVKRAKEDFRMISKKALSANMEDLPATRAAKVDNEEQDLVDLVRLHNLKVDNDTLQLIVDKVKDFRNSEKTELIVPDNLSYNHDSCRTVKCVAEMYGLRFDADDERKLFRVLK